MGYIGEREELQRVTFEPLPDERDTPAEPSPEVSPAAEPAEPGLVPAGRVLRDPGDAEGMAMDMALYGDVFTYAERE